MKEAPSYLKTMGRMVDPAPNVEQAEARRLAMVASIERAAVEAKATAARARRVRRTWGTIAAAAGFLAVIGGIAGWSNDNSGDRDREPTVLAQAVPTKPTVASAPSSKVSVSPGVKVIEGALKSDLNGVLRPGDLVSTGMHTIGPVGAARIQLENGAELLGEPLTRLRLEVSRSPVGGEELVRLEDGAVLLSVPRLTPGQRLLVQTDEALVEVRGTRFRVERKVKAGAPRTRVSVSEGLVSVVAGDAEVFLRAGEEWESGAPATAQPKDVRSGALRGDPPEVQDEKVAAASALAEQNRIYQSALLASRNGFDDLAKLRFEQLLRDHPESPLAAGARRELARLSAAKDETP